MDPDVVARVQCHNLLLAAAFLAQRSDLVVVGGCALMLHGRDHAPADLDLVPEPSLANLQRLFDAVGAFGVPGRERRPNDHVMLTGEIVRVTTSVGPIDVLLERGREEYAALDQGARSISVREREVRVAAVDDVLEMRARFGKVTLDA